MTDNERHFLELKLRVWLRKLKREKAGFAGHRTPNDWSCELTDTAKNTYVMWYIPVRAVMCLRVKNLAYLLSCSRL